MNISDTKFDLGRIRFQFVLDEWKRLVPQHQWILQLGNDSIEEKVPAYADAMLPAIGLLDEESWQVMRRNIAERYNTGKDGGGRGSHQVFDLLDEALAYQHLVDMGFEQVRLQSRSKVKGVTSPDIRFFARGQQYCCEVKSIGESDENRKRFEKQIGFDPRIYERLDDRFFAKLNDVTEVARNQIARSGLEGLVYLIVRFDDYTGRHASTYRGQIDAFFDEQPLKDNLIVRCGRNSFIQPIIRIQKLY